MTNITLKEIPVNRDDEESLTNCDVGGDRGFEIIVDDTVTIGHVFLSEDTETPSGIHCQTYINWLEILSVYQCKGLLKPILNALADMFEEIYFEAADGTNEKYRHIGAKSLGIDELTELEIFKYRNVA